MTRKVVIRATDFLAAGAVRETSLKFGPLDIGSRIGIASFETVPGASLPFLPREYDYVEVTDTDGVTLRFTGHVRTVERERLVGLKENGAPSGSYWKIDCQDWAAELERVNVDVDQVWTAGDNDKHMVESLVTQYWGAIATTGLTHTITARRTNMLALTLTQGSKNMRQALDQIALLAGNVSWYVDPKKQLHWNDVLQIAPFTMKDGISTGAGGLYRGYSSIKDYVDMTGVGFRVTVIGDNGVVATVTDWPGFFKYNLRRTDERGTPNVRFFQLNDVTDAALKTVGDCQQRGFQELARVAPRRRVTLRTYDSGLYPGQAVDIIDSDSGTGTVPYVMPDDGAFVASTPGDLSKSKGRFLVQRVSPTARGAENWEYVVECGAYLPTFEQAVAA